MNRVVTALLFVIVGATVSCGQEDTGAQIRSSIEEYSAALASKDQDNLRGYFNPSYRSYCPPGPLSEIINETDDMRDVEVLSVESVDNKIVATANGPWGDAGIFVADPEANSDAETGGSPFLADPMLSQCLENTARQAHETWIRISERLGTLNTRLDAIGLAEDEGIADLWADGQITFAGVDLDRASNDSDAVDRMAQMAPASDLLVRLENAEQRMPELEGLIPMSLEDCRMKNATREVCSRLGFIDPVVYTGPYSFAGTGDAVTEEFCMTSGDVAADYQIGEGSNGSTIVSLYDSWYGPGRVRQDPSFELVGSGELSWETYGMSCFYLEVLSDTAWQITVK
jgi:hypothetical protein